MKHTFFKLFLVGAAIAMGTACTKDFDTINIDPNNPASVPVDLLLTTAQKETMDEVVDQWNNGRFGMVYAQYWSQNQYTEESRYLPRVTVTNNFWRALYAGIGLAAAGGGGGGMADLTRIIELAGASATNDAANAATYNNQAAIAHILRVYYAQIATDAWGDVPYSEAFKGVENLSPKFDRQSDLYAALLAELNTAISTLDAEAGSFSSGDLLYGGDVAAWKTFANSLKLRLAIRMADVNADVAKTAIEEAVAAGVMTSNADNAVLIYGGAAPDNHPLNEDRKTRRDFSSSETMVGYLKTTGDPRLFAFYDPVTGSTAGEWDSYVGRPYGQTPGDANAMTRATVSQPSGYNLFTSGGFDATDVLRPDANAVYMDYAEVCFILAEAAARGFISEDAATWYNNGVTASMEYWQAGTSDDVTAFLTANPYDAANWKQSIGRQKWVALYMQGIQGWIEYRRLDFGLLVAPVGGSLDADANEVPTRLFYPTDVTTLNTENYNAAVAAQGADKLTTKVWWDVN